MELGLLIQPAVGAVIGYFTNWLAIKMLFRPHNEIRVFNIKLPFTPGLIPKERYRLSKKVAQTVSTHLLTKESITTELLSPETLDKIRLMLDKSAAALGSDERTVGEALRILFSRDIDADIYDYIDSAVASLAKNDSLKAYTADLITEKLTETMRAMDLYGGGIDALLERIAEKLYESVSTGPRPINELFPQEITEAVLGAAEEAMPGLIEAFKRLPEEYPELDQTLASLVEKIISDGFGKLVGAFINHEKIYTNMKNGLFDYLSEGENQTILAGKLRDVVTGFLTRDVSEIMSRMPEREALTHKTAAFIKQLMKDMFTDVEPIVADSSFIIEPQPATLSLYDAAERAFPGFHEHLREFIYKKLDEFMTNDMPGLAHSVSEDALNRLYGCKISDIIEWFGEKTVNDLKDAALKAIRFILEKGAVYFAETVDINKMVEEKINAFEVAEAEEIILSVVNNELNAITIVGGLLGAAIGGLSVLMRM